MKTKILKISTVLIVLFFCSKVQAQNQVNQVICPGGSTTTYTVDEPTGTPGSTYAWTVSGTGYAGSIQGAPDNDNSITVNWGATPPGTYTISVVETNSNCTGETKTYQVGIRQPLTASVSNGNTYCKGVTATPLSVTVTGATEGDTLKYKWFSNATDSTTGGTEILGATSSTFTPPTDVAGTTYYYAEVEGPCGVMTTNTAKIIVNEVITSDITAE